MQDSEVRRGKIELTIGDVSFAGKGDQDWLDQQIRMLIDVATREKTSSSADDVSPKPEPKQNETVSTGSLASYLRAKGADSVQLQRFLATAGWLYHRGTRDLTTRAVSKTLQENQQKRLSNASDCLNKNVARGFCEKTASGFFVTPEGWRHLGEGED